MGFALNTVEKEKGNNSKQSILKKELFRKKETIVNNPF